MTESVCSRVGRMMTAVAAGFVTCGLVLAQSAPQDPAQNPGLFPVPNVMGSQVPGIPQTIPQNSAQSQTHISDAVPPPIAPLPHGEGARRMGERVRKIIDGYDWKSDPNKPFERIVYLQVLLTRHLSLRDEITARIVLANEELRAGRSERAMETMETLVQHIQAHLNEVPRVLQADVHQLLALSYLRMREQENCIGMHNALSCNFPLRGGGMHQKLRGAEGAVREYTRTLELKPDSNLARWLLNLAYMQLGRYPQDVPKKWLVPQNLFDSEYDVGFFPDVAGLAGVDAFERSGGTIVEDFDGDGLLDILLSSSGPLDSMHFFRNNGDGTFTDRTKAAGLGDEIGGLNVVLTDYNNDGHPDVLVLRGGWWGKFGQFPMSLLRNNGDGTFDDVTEEAGLLVNGPGQTAAWVDFDGDGWLDFFVGHESKPGDEHPSELFHNKHDGTFAEVKAPGGAATNVVGLLGSNLGFVKGVSWGDYNNDGRPDLYVSTMFGPSYLFRNDGPRNPNHPESGDWVFTDVTQQAGLGGKRYTFPTWFFDFDNDGWLDVFAGGYSTESMEDVGSFMLGRPHHASVSHLYRNNHDGTFSDLPHAVGLDRAITVMGANFGDLDNDGWLDVYLGVGDPSYEALMPKRMFRNDRGRYFQDVTTSGGFGNLQKGHGVAFADVENDSNEDVMEELGGAYPGDKFHAVLYRNPGHGNHWITLSLEGVKTNRAAYGARVKITIDERGKQRSIYRAVGSVSSFGGNPMRQHIGVGQSASIHEIEITWPASGIRQRFNDVAVDHAYRIREDRDTLETLNWKTFEIGKTKIARPLDEHNHAP